MTTNSVPPVWARWFADADNCCILGLLLCVFSALLAAGGTLTYFGFFSEQSVTAADPHHLSAALAALGPLLLAAALLLLVAAGRLYRAGGCSGQPEWLQRHRPYSTMESGSRDGSVNPGFESAEG
ncbi:uncharacterized protein LOC122388771 [Amphibalanus amphitrite]|uniref:uncharacterized protein LOC122388771 n=1 Tax=Amphibalanus amphitrite TaxID=1232801 RepID=UPI001C92B8D4|nr:uncharacterized protein LOC122388771 [Amphibalanus amphitrite]